MQFKCQPAQELHQIFTDYINGINLSVATATQKQSSILKLSATEINSDMSGFTASYVIETDTDAYEQAHYEAATDYLSEHTSYCCKTIAEIIESFIPKLYYTDNGPSFKLITNDPKYPQHYIYIVSAKQETTHLITITEMDLAIYITLTDRGL